MKAIIIGATSGIGKELAIQMSEAGYQLGITGRRGYLLDSLAQQLTTPCYKSVMDISQIPSSVNALKQLLTEMKDVDIIIINAGIGSMEPSFPLNLELDTIAINVSGFSAMAHTAYHYFAQRQQGHIVGISSISALRGGNATSYNASKAYMANYLEGLAIKAYSEKKDIAVTDIRPGFVDTAMAKGARVFWKAPTTKAVNQILFAIRQQRRVVYITKRWYLIALLLRNLPFALYRKLVT